VKIRPVGDELFLSERQRRTDMTKRKVAFRRFVKEPKTVTFYIKD